MKFDSIESAINEIRNGQSVIIIDDAGHSMLEKGIQEKLIYYTDKFSKL